MNMYIKYLILAIPLLLYSCLEEKKEECKNVTEIPTTTNHLVDVSEVSKHPQIKSLLDTYKDRLQVERISEFTSPYTNKTTTTLHCKTYYKGFQILTGYYLLNEQDNAIFWSGKLPPDTIALSLKPNIMINQAIRTARQEGTFNGNCMAFRLGIHEKATIDSSEYHLAWLIEDSMDGFPQVIIDAHSGEVLRN